MACDVSPVAMFVLHFALKTLGCYLNKSFATCAPTVTIVVRFISNEHICISFGDKNLLCFHEGQICQIFLQDMFENLRPGIDIFD